MPKREHTTGAQRTSLGSVVKSKSDGVTRNSPVGRH